VPSRAQALFDILASYHVMAQWHGLAVAKQGQMAAEAAQSKTVGQSPQPPAAAHGQSEPYWF
jgi:hypothetical protein